jgi:predicted DNA-binding protein (UPF0251 family)
VEVVHLYSNPKVRPEALLHLLVKATSALRPSGHPISIQTQVRLSPDRAKELTTAYRAGKTIKELAQRYGVHRATVSSLLRRLGVEQRQVGLTDAQVAEAFRLYREGSSLARLAERYAVDDMTVRRYLLLAGCVMRLPHERRR